MKIAYAIMGEGRGHVSRFLTLAPFLDAEILVLAGGDAYDFLKNSLVNSLDFEIKRIPTFSFSYKNGKAEILKSAVKTVSHIKDFKSYSLMGNNALGWSPNTEEVAKTIEQFQPDVIISDSESYTQHIITEVPVVSIDRFSKIAFCESPIPLGLMDNMDHFINKLSYRFLLKANDRVFASSFYDAPVRAKYIDKVNSYGPMIRALVKSATPSEGDHIVVYATNPGLYSDEFFLKLEKQPRKVKIYGFQNQKHSYKNLTFESLHEERFVEDIATAAYVISSPGNMLLSELGYMGKKMLALNTAPFEQRFNAIIAEQLGIARRIDINMVLPEELEAAFQSLPNYARLQDYTNQIAGDIKNFIG